MARLLDTKMRDKKHEKIVQFISSNSLNRGINDSIYSINILFFPATHPGKTLTYYASSLIVYFFLVCFGLFNAWQLSVSLALRRYLASQEKFSSFARVDMPAPVASVGMVTKSGDDHPCTA